MQTPPVSYHAALARISPAYRLYILYDNAPQGFPTWTQVAEATNDEAGNTEPESESIRWVDPEIGSIFCHFPGCGEPCLGRAKLTRHVSCAHPGYRCRPGRAGHVAGKALRDANTFYQRAMANVTAPPDYERFEDRFDAAHHARVIAAHTARFASRCMMNIVPQPVPQIHSYVTNASNFIDAAAPLATDQQYFGQAGTSTELATHTTGDSADEADTTSRREGYIQRLLYASNDDARLGENRAPSEAEDNTWMLTPSPEGRQRQLPVVVPTFSTTSTTSHLNERATTETSPVADATTLGDVDSDAGPDWRSIQIPLPCLPTVRPTLFTGAACPEHERPQRPLLQGVDDADNFMRYSVITRSGANYGGVDNSDLKRQAKALAKTGRPSICYPCRTCTKTRKYKSCFKIPQCENYAFTYTEDELDHVQAQQRWLDAHGDAFLVAYEKDAAEMMWGTSASAHREAMAKLVGSRRDVSDSIPTASPGTLSVFDAFGPPRNANARTSGDAPLAGNAFDANNTRDNNNARDDSDTRDDNNARDATSLCNHNNSLEGVRRAAATDVYDIGHVDVDTANARGRLLKRQRTKN